jgi:hypothetical protein
MTADVSFNSVWIFERSTDDDLSTIPGDFEQTATTLVSTRSVFSVAMATSVRPPVFDDDFDSQVGLHRFTASQCVNEVSGTLH